MANSDRESQGSGPMVLFRVVLADRHCLLRQELKRILSEESNLEVVGEAEEGFDLMRILSVNGPVPHLVIFDPSMPNLQGTKAIRTMKTIHSDLKVLVVSLHEEEEYLTRAISDGAEGYLLKDSLDKELLPAIQRIMQGELYVSIPPEGKFRIVDGQQF